MEQGLVNKYRVYRQSDGKEVHGFFVLRPEKDEAARKAMLEYAKHCENRILGEQLESWVREFEEHKCVDPSFNRLCLKVNSPVCCCHCPIRNECYDEGGKMCYMAESGDVMSVEECKYYND